ncbi:MAG: serine hydrolase [Sedimentisphaerales bacterium]|nr:serine hydrolase [Sedimentisphaerales bacterium]
MRKSQTLFEAITLMLTIACPLLGATIYPNDDCTTRGGANYNATSVFGLLIKGPSDFGWMEYDIGEIPAEEAALTIYQAWESVQNEWEIIVKGAEFDFDETTFTGTNVGSWTLIGAIPGIRSKAIYTIDITDFYNDHLGRTAAFQLSREVQPSGDGPIFEDREGTLTGDGVQYGPKVNITLATIKGDFEPDGDVDYSDVLSLFDFWLHMGCGEPNQWCFGRDLDTSEIVNFFDFALLALNWHYGVRKPPKPATNSCPQDGAIGVSVGTDLTWTAGEGAASHNVYFGTSYPPPFQLSQPSTTFDPGILDPSTTYHWRIDEASRIGTTQGPSWSFTTGALTNHHEIVFPGSTWQFMDPGELGLDSSKLDEFAGRVGGVGCVVRQGYMVKTWGSENSKGDWASAAKPVLSTMLLFAVKEGLLSTPHDRIGDWGWALSAKDEAMEFYHLANMTSGYARGEAPGTAWAYNDYAISLYAKTLFDRVFQSTADSAARHPDRLGALEFQDGSVFSSRDGYGIYTSPRDFARIGWFWCNKGYWGGRQLLPRYYFEEYMRPLVPGDVPRSTAAGSDYLEVGTYGGGTDQTEYGPGIYGFNWWHNPGRANWPNAPEDTIQANGHWGGEVVTVIPSLSLVAACRGNNGSFEPGNADSSMNQNLRLLVEACPPFPLGQIVVDPCDPSRMVYRAVYESGENKPVCFAGPGDPEDFFYNNPQDNLDLLIARGARCTYITAVLQDFGGGDPGSGSALDAKLVEWEGYIEQLEQAGVITVFVLFDDSQPLTPNWEELVDKCVAKFQHHKLLIWMVAEEYSEALTQAQVSQVAALIKQMDPFDHVVGVHQLNGNTFDFLDDANIDMFMMQLNQSTAAGLHAMVRNSNVNGKKILNMAEAADHAKQTRETVRKWNWASIMGGAGAVQVLWMGRASDPADWNSQEKYDDCIRLMDFMELLRFNETRSRDDLARGNTDYVLANPGQVYILYGDVGGSLGVYVEEGDYGVIWYDPVDGDWINQGIQQLSTGEQTFLKPSAISDEAVVYLASLIEQDTIRHEASNADPPDGVTNVSILAGLNWAPGAGSESHEIYFGTTSPPPLVTTQTEATYTPAVPMSRGVTYYWRIGEVSPRGKTLGQIWSFTTETGGTR